MSVFREWCMCVCGGGVHHMFWIARTVAPHSPRTGDWTVLSWVLGIKTGSSGKAMSALDRCSNSTPCLLFSRNLVHSGSVRKIGVGIIKRFDCWRNSEWWILVFYLRAKTLTCFECLLVFFLFRKVWQNLVVLVVLKGRILSCHRNERIGKIDILCS